MAHASWKGFLRLSLVTVPVQAFNVATTSKGEVSFNQLHAACNSRIKYQKTCPIHGEVPNTEIVKGYEFAKGQYVIVDEDEIEALRGPADQTVNIDKFIKPGAIDPVYFEGHTYFLLPDGELADKPYAVLHKVLKAKGVWGLAIANFSRRAHLSVLRAADGVLCMDTLHYATDLRTPEDIGKELHLPAVGAEEARLAAMLIDASTAKSVNLAAYKDDYNDQLRALLEAKAAGREIVAPPQEETAPTINLMDALKKSITKSKARQVAKDTLSRAHGRRAATSKRKSG